MFYGDRFVLRPLPLALALDEAEYRLRKHLLEIIWRTLIRYNARVAAVYFEWWSINMPKIKIESKTRLISTLSYYISCGIERFWYLVSSDEMDGNAYVGEVDQPEGLVEAKSGEEVPRSIVAEGGVAETAT